jgi:hypothetical protein
MEENHNRAAALAGMPYLSGLASQFATIPAYSAITHPSLPNYLAVTGGSTFGKTRDCGTSTTKCTVNATNIFNQQGSNWRQWSESMPSPCDHTNAGDYIVHHAVPPFYTDLNATCPTDDIPFSKSSVPQISAAYTFITPNNKDNAHSGSLGAADGWLKGVIGKLLAQTAYTNGSTLIEITFDEGSNGSNNVLTVLCQPSLKKLAIGGSANHYSLLRLDEELLGDPLLGSAQTARDLRPALGL